MGNSYTPNEIYDHMCATYDINRIESEGRFFHLKDSIRTEKGQEGGTSNGYIGLNYKQYRMSHLVWLAHHGELPKSPLYYVDGNRHNNHIENLTLDKQALHPKIQRYYKVGKKLFSTYEKALAYVQAQER
jgi:hypothetical protein